MARKEEDYNEGRKSAAVSAFAFVGTRALTSSSALADFDCLRFSVCGRDSSAAALENQTLKPARRARASAESSSRSVLRWPAPQLFASLRSGDPEISPPNYFSGFWPATCRARASDRLPSSWSVLQTSSDTSLQARVQTSLLQPHVRRSQHFNSACSGRLRKALAQLLQSMTTPRCHLDSLTATSLPGHAFAGRASSFRPSVQRAEWDGRSVGRPARQEQTAIRLASC